METTATLEDLEIANTGVQKLRRRKPSHNPSIASRPFAGRIGGNQEFTISPYDASFTKTPDASAIFSWKSSLSLLAFADPELWKQSCIEGVGTCLQVYISGLVSAGLGNIGVSTSLGSVAPAAFGSVVTGILVSLFIFGGGPVSGGHFNPLITIATFVARLSTFPRCVLYVVSQCVGAVVAGCLVRVSLALKPDEILPVPGCFIDTNLVTPGEAYVKVYIIMWCC